MTVLSHSSNNSVGMVCAFKNMKRKKKTNVLAISSLGPSSGPWFNILREMLQKVSIESSETTCTFSISCVENLPRQRG